MNGALNQQINGNDKWCLTLFIRKRFETRTMNVWKVITGIFMLIFGICFFSRIYLRIHYAHTLLTVPQPNLGRVFPHTYKGIAVFLTQQEASLLNYLWWLTLIAIVGVCCIAVYRKDYLIFNQNK